MDKTVFRDRMHDHGQDILEEATRAGKRARRRASRLAGDFRETAGSAASSAEGIAEDIRSSDIVTRSYKYARQNPAVVIGGAVVLGFALTRLLRK
ncbi:hypothetical protein [Falsirhodobacter sp. alg1]|uniref:hypothetical protein n=1 Tax=Falsirhodobacter sp. alg1 TaxID=1472418 RepID=UPI00128EF131|nr:hypothetical protein [Falsirhodobacter sp. alg1]